MQQLVVCIDNIKIANNLPFVLFGGINVLESRDLVMTVCEHFVNITNNLNIPYIFKASFDKANRSSWNSYRGPGLIKGIKMLQELKETFGIKIITDIHEPYQANIISKIVNIIQLPAFLARQTDLIYAIAKTNLPVNIKKPQFMSPHQIIHVVNKFRKFGNNQIILCERGSCFGYNNLIVDILGLRIMNEISCGCPVILDASHSLQIKNQSNNIFKGKRKQIIELAKAGIATGIAGLFIEAHPHPDKAKCDGLCALPLDKLKIFLKQIKDIDELIKSFINIDIK